MMIKNRYICKLHVALSTDRLAHKKGEGTIKTCSKVNKRVRKPSMNFVVSFQLRFDYRSTTTLIKSYIMSKLENYMAHLFYLNVILYNKTDIPF